MGSYIFTYFAAIKKNNCIVINKYMLTIIPYAWNINIDVLNHRPLSGRSNYCVIIPSNQQPLMDIPR